MSLDYHLVRLGVPSRSDTIHVNTCRCVKGKPNQLRWTWAEANPDEDWVKTAPWLHQCLVCHPPSPFNARPSSEGK